MRTSLIVILILLFGSCKQETNSTKTEPVKMGAEGALEHLVFFSLKDSLPTEDVERFKNLLLTLDRIEGVIEVEVNSRSDVGDSRALNYDLLMVLEFEAISYLNTYAEHPYHLEVRDSLMPYLAAPPATFDFEPDQ